MNTKTYQEVLAINKLAKQRARLWFNLPRQQVKREQENKTKTKSESFN